MFVFLYHFLFDHCRHKMLVPECSEKLINELRTTVLKQIQDANPDNFYKLDIEKVESDNSWLNRFLVHRGTDIEKTSRMVINAMKWRKEFGVREINEANLPAKFFEIRAAYPFCRDKEDCKTIMFHSRLYEKKLYDSSDIQRFFIYWMEKMEVEEKGHPISILFDMTGVGFANVDLEMVKFINIAFNYYYPFFMGTIIVYEMPWILNAIWTLIKPWLPASALARVKFVTKSTIQEYIDADQLPVNMGGSVI